jgi:outer membrane protein insertion porin family/translocation and assembly module TamA
VGASVKLGWLSLLMFVAMSPACKSVPEARTGVASIRFRGNSEISSGDLRDRIATRQAPKFLGVFRASWLRYEDFEPEVLAKDLERVRHYYQRRGYYDAEVRAGRILPEGKLVDVEVVVEEGDPVRVHSVAAHGLEDKQRTVVERAKERIALSVGDVFDQDKLETSTKGITAALANLGYAYADVVPGAVVDLGPRTVDIAFQIDPGIPCRIGAVTFEGLGDLPEPVIRRTFGVFPGDVFAADDLEAGRRALVDLGVFASVEVIPDLSDKTRAAVPVRVVLTRSAPRGFRLGAGLLLDFTRSDVHFLVGWEHRNFLGGMRHFSVEDRPALVFFPTSLSVFHFPEHVFLANSFAATFTQPAFPEARTTSSVRLEFNSYPVLVAPVNPAQEIFPGYHQLRFSTGPERFFPFINFRAGVFYNLQANFPFAYRGEVNPAFTTVLVSYVDLKTQFDLRDDPIDTHQGFLLQNSLQFAGSIFGGDAKDIRINPEMRMYVPVAGDVVLAGRVVLGLDLARNYGQTLGTPFLAIPNAAAAQPYIRDLQIVYFRGFFSGGPDSNRGYPFNDIGPHGVNPLFIPGTFEEEKLRCLPGSMLFDERLCSVASGGLSMWGASLELRVPVVGSLGTVLFADASDVSPDKLQIRLNVPHLSVGFGIRYATPVGPVRLDVGIRVPGAQKIGAPLNPLTDGPEPEPFLGLPIAIAIGVGETY